MLEISSQKMEESLGVDFAQIFQASSVYEKNKALIKELSTPEPGVEELRFSTVFSQSFSMQCLACFWKQHKSYWRNPHYIVVKFFFTTISSLIFGSLYWKLGSKTGTLQDLFNTLGGMYAATLFIGISNSSAVQPVVGVERMVYYRERAAGMYSPLPYAFAQVAIEVPYVLLQTLLYGCVVYPMMNFQWTAAKFLWFIFFMFFTFLYFSYYGMMCVAVTPSHHFAAIISSAFYGLWNLYSGFLIPRPQIPVWWRWYYWVCPVAWTLYGLISSQVGDVDDKTVVIPGQGSRIVSDYIREYFGFHHDFLGVVALMHVVFTVVFALVFAICIKYFNFQRR